MSKNLVSVVLPESLKKFSGRVLTLDQISNIYTYCSNTAEYEIDWDMAFDADEFTGITFYGLIGNRYAVWALHDSLDIGPDFFINQKSDDVIHQKLRAIIVDYLNAHPEKGITIDQFG